MDELNQKPPVLYFIKSTSFLRAVKVCLEFGYEVEFTGVGQAPPGQQETVGFCSQIGVFCRLGGRSGCNMLLGDDAEDVFSHTLVSMFNFWTNFWFSTLSGWNWSGIGVKIYNHRCFPFG